MTPEEEAAVAAGPEVAAEAVDALKHGLPVPKLPKASKPTGDLHLPQPK